jgi:hypothetical protein
MLLNADIKVIAHIIVKLLGLWILSIIHKSQHCGIREHTIIDAVATVREAIAQAEHIKWALCILSLDFQAAFDNTSHQYLFQILETYGFSARFQRRIRNTYENATSSIHINGHTSSPISIRCAVRQGCPLNMQLYALFLNPLLCTCMLDDTLKGITIGRHNTKTAVVAYVDDVTIFLTSPLDVPALRTSLDTHEKASGAHINMHKSKEMAMDERKTSVNVLNIPHYTDMEVMAVHFTSSIYRSADTNWAIVAGQIRTQAKDAYIRKPCMENRIQYIHNYLLARAWYMAQILPMPEGYRRQIDNAITEYQW